MQVTDYHCDTRFSYPEEFVAKVKKSFPLHVGIHKLLNEGTVFPLGIALLKAGREDLLCELYQFWYNNARHS